MVSLSQESVQQFFTLLDIAQNNQSWIKLLLGKYRGAEKDLKRVTVRPIILRNAAAWSFVYSYSTCDITKNVTPQKGLALIQRLLEVDFRAAHLFSDCEDAQLEINKKGKASLHIAISEKISTVSSDHDRTKRRFVDISQPFLAALGVTDSSHKLIPAMAGKWKQINKFIEIFSQALSGANVSRNSPLTVVDFGSGKGYLTFALHDYLCSTEHNQAKVTGVELRTHLVELCNATASTLQDPGLLFVCGDIKTQAPERCDVMIALHACDTATDHAIHYGIRAQASIIMCSPCCHKQIRPQMRSPVQLKPMLRYGVHMGQEADMVTDTLRALLLEANGYRTKVFEFISTEHTDKNKMILAVKQPPGVLIVSARQQALEQIAAIKEFYSIQEQCLESLLRE